MTLSKIFLVVARLLPGPGSVQQLRKRANEEYIISLFVVGTSHWARAIKNSAHSG